VKKFLLVTALLLALPLAPLSLYAVQAKASTDNGYLGNDDWVIDDDGDLVPLADSSKDIGAKGSEVDNAYIDDLAVQGINFVTCTSDALGLSYTVTASAYPELKTGLMLMFTAPYANSGTAPTLTYNGTTDNIKKLNNASVSADHIEQYQICIVVFNGTDWVIINEDANP
jgi:hypothetical protein